MVVVSLHWSDRHSISVAVHLKKKIFLFNLIFIRSSRILRQCDLQCKKRTQKNSLQNFALEFRGSPTSTACRSCRKALGSHRFAECDAPSSQSNVLSEIIRFFNASDIRFFPLVMLIIDFLLPTFWRISGENSSSVSRISVEKLEGLFPTGETCSRAWPHAISRYRNLWPCLSNHASRATNQTENPEKGGDRNQSGKSRRMEERGTHKFKDYETNVKWRVMDLLTSGVKLIKVSRTPAWHIWPAVCWSSRCWSHRNVQQSWNAPWQEMRLSW